MTAVLTDALALSKDAQDLLFHEARTANAFTDEPVTEDEVRAIYELVKWAPTAMNTQPLRVLLVRSDEANERLSRHMTEPNRAKTLKAPLTAILAADTNFHDHLHRTFPHVPNAKDKFADETGRRAAAKLSTGLQIGYFILGIRAAGLDAGPMAGFDAEGVRAEFFAGTGIEPLVVVNIGHVAEGGSRPRNPRLDYAEVVSSV
ncbi:malonic semialdehyde reductase [Solihabitans fulvus]|uniref:Malonic semialdehyde reductase n=1 Tax=Solihabitans fulvus TaxID=1892852 RepID=A0A5B2X6U3_9PSEU|nr:malonic semialdehyde reductase [Solihabitans fulvus]KAA2258841.1 malonic semialdehyde reductase [Solihabitans fulvus]